jgi:hypothetical protein
MSTAAAAPPASVSEALEMLTSAMRYLAAADATQMATEVQAQCLAGLEQADAIETAARASVLGAFTAGQGYCEDADYSPRSWLIHKTRITSLNNQHELEGSGVVTGQGNRADTQGQVGLVLTSSSEEEAGEPFGTVCPLSVAPRSRSRPVRPADRDISVRVVMRRQGSSAF